MVLAATGIALDKATAETAIGEDLKLNAIFVPVNAT